MTASTPLMNGHKQKNKKQKQKQKKGNDNLLSSSSPPSYPGQEVILVRPQKRTYHRELRPCRRARLLVSYRKLNGYKRTYIYNIYNVYIYGW